MELSASVDPAGGQRQTERERERAKVKEICKCFEIPKKSYTFHFEFYLAVSFASHQTSSFLSLPHFPKSEEEEEEEEEEEAGFS